MYLVPYTYAVGFSDGSDGKESAGSSRDLGLIPGLGKSPGRGNTVFLPGESYGQRSLVGYSPQCRRVGND